MGVGLHSSDGADDKWPDSVAHELDVARRRRRGEASEIAGYTGGEAEALTLVGAGGGR